MNKETTYSIEVAPGSGIYRTEAGLVDVGTMTRPDFDAWRLGRFLRRVSPIERSDDDQTAVIDLWPTLPSTQSPRPQDLGQLLG